jgi:hypothetical protein
MERLEKMLKPKAYNGKGDMGIQYSFTRFLMPKGDWIRVDYNDGGCNIQRGPCTVNYLIILPREGFMVKTYQKEELLLEGLSRMKT